MSNQEPLPEPKQVELKDRTFIANGNKYYITDRISIDRWKQYEKLVPRLTYGVGFNEMQAALTKAFAALNKQQFANAAIILHNVMSGIVDAENENRVTPGLMMCALVMNKEGENTAIYDEQVMNDKIQDWRTEGLDILSFFKWALNSINGFRATHIQLIQEQANELIQKSDLMEPME